MNELTEPSAGRIDAGVGAGQVDLAFVRGLAPHLVADELDQEWISPGGGDIVSSAGGVSERSLVSFRLG